MMQLMQTMLMGSNFKGRPGSTIRRFLQRIETITDSQMPLPRYAMLHSEARLTDAEVQTIYELTKAERRALRRE
jgi:hypothetical protein